jgi:hypothetical protein
VAHRSFHASTNESECEARLVINRKGECEKYSRAIASVSESKRQFLFVRESVRVRERERDPERTRERGSDKEREIAAVVLHCMQALQAPYVHRGSLDHGQLWATR